MRLIALLLAGVWATVLHLRELKLPTDTSDSIFILLVPDSSAEICDFAKEQSLKVEYYAGGSLAWSQKLWTHLASDYSEHSLWAVIKERDKPEGKCVVLGAVHNDYKEADEINQAIGRLTKRYPSCELAYAFI